ncbi:MAG: phosphate/phosphite/phosphonate ABC transporter substrate-binding protein [Candidatus Ozemobacteraceae bacterium]
MQKRNIAVVFCILLVISVVFFLHFQEKEKPDYIPHFKDTPETSIPTYIFGVHPLHSPTLFFEVYQPLVDFLNANMGNCKIVLEGSKDYQDFEEKLYANKFHIALPNPYQTIQAVNRAGYTIFGKVGDDAQFTGIILTRKESNIRSINELKGRVISYPSKTALAACIQPQWFLFKHGLNIHSDIINNFVGTQESSILSVATRLSDAGCTWPPPWKLFQKKFPEIASKLVVAWETEPLINLGLVASADFPSAYLEEISRLLFSLHTQEKGREILNGMGYSNFEPATLLTYKPVQDFLQEFEKNVRRIDEN